jgi:hypothetical protein
VVSAARRVGSLGEEIGRAASMVEDASARKR